MGTEAGTRAMRPQATARRPPQRREEAGRCGPEPGEGRGPAAAESRLPAPGPREDELLLYQPPNA